MPTPYVYAFPCLHSALNLGHVLLPAALLPCGLEESLPLQPLRQEFPFPPRTAKLVLSEMLELGQGLGAAGLAEQRFAAAMPPPYTNDYEEDRTLEAFMASGNVPIAQGTAENADMRVKDCQKVLLLAWQLEDYFIEMERLEACVREADASLRKNLGHEEKLLAETTAILPHATLPTRPPTVAAWKAVVEAAAAFLPLDAVFITHEPSIAQPMAERFGPCPLPQHLAHWQQEMPGLRCAHAPLWQLLGKKAPAPDRPWQLEKRVILFTV
ncbi:hypothetical protein [Desulfovibrio cuneatus]|uniref:hypothetical protein n=1 Tax=Desulfovibrio cuneatus TaxID=159728 RepID=UPI0003F52355|nr:hypothetical protein [Desulfovibrio cuneatus]